MPVVAQFRPGTPLEVVRQSAARPSAEAEAAMRAFAEAGGEVIRGALAAGRPCSTAEGQRVVWVHPDGSRRLSPDPAAPKA